MNIAPLALKFIFIRSPSDLLFFRSHSLQTVHRNIHEIDAPFILLRYIHGNNR